MPKYTVLAIEYYSVAKFYEVEADDAKAAMQVVENAYDNQAEDDILVSTGDSQYSHYELADVEEGWGDEE